MNVVINRSINQSVRQVLNRSTCMPTTNALMLTDWLTDWLIWVLSDSQKKRRMILRCRAKGNLSELGCGISQFSSKEMRTDHDKNHFESKNHLQHRSNFLRRDNLQCSQKNTEIEMRRNKESARENMIDQLWVQLHETETENQRVGETEEKADESQQTRRKASKEGRQSCWRKNSVRQT